MDRKLQAAAFSCFLHKINSVEVKLRLTLYYISMEKRNQVIYNEKA